MPKQRLTEHARVVRYFQAAPIDEAELVFSIVKGIMDTRGGASRRAALTTKKTRSKSTSPTETPTQEAPHAAKQWGG